MNLDLPWLALGSFASGFGSLYLLAQLQAHWDKPVARWCVATIVTQTAEFQQRRGTAGVRPELRRARRCSWLGIIWIGFCFLSFALGYTGRTNVLESGWYRGVAVLPLVETALVVTTHSIRGRQGFRVVPAAGSAGADSPSRRWDAPSSSRCWSSRGTLLVFDTVVSYGPLYRREALAVG